MADGQNNIIETVRCAWAEQNDLERVYHDTEWGVPCHDSQKLFDKLCLEGAQAGLSWDTILRKRDEYRRVFHNFDIKKVAHMTDRELEDILRNSSVVRNRLKIFSVRKNALAVQEIMKTQDFADYIWSFVGGKTVQNNWHDMSEIPASTDVSECMSKDLKKRGLTFVGPTICYAFMQSMGIVNDHVVSCFRHKEVKNMGGKL